MFNICDEKPTNMTTEEYLNFRLEWEFWRGYILGKVPKEKLKSIEITKEGGIKHENS